MASLLSILRRPVFAFLMVTGILGAWRTAWAEEVSASAALSSNTAGVGEAVSLEVTIKGALQAGTRPDVKVDGLHVQYQGYQNRFESRNFRSITNSVTHTFVLVPQRAGTFTIPALRMEAGGKTVSTRPLTLTVTASANRGAQPAPGGGAAPDASNERLAFAEWVLPKSTGYVGETIPAELRLYVASNIRWTLQQLPTVSGDGFTMQKLPRDPIQSNVTKDGRAYDMVVFKTAITAAKAGTLTLAPTELNAVAQIPRRRAPSSRSRMPGFDDMFDDPFFERAFGMVEQPVVIRTEPVEFQIKPVPAAGRPKSFSGAVGQFTLETKASPLKIQAGDPVTLTAEVSGIGSFDRMGAPMIMEEQGWRSYPPSAKFTPDDEAGVSGKKTFEIALIPEGPKKELPKVEFSYFDPSKEQYVTLTGDPIAIAVEGSAAPSPTPAMASSVSPGASPQAAATARPVDDILFIRPDSGRWGLTFEPAWRTRAFWLSQAAPLAALLLLSGWKWRRRRLSDGRARRLAALRQAKSEAARTLRQTKIGPGGFYGAAVRVLQLEAVLGGRGAASEREPETLDAEAVCGSRPLDPEVAAEVRALFAAHDEFRYAGAGSAGEGEPAISPDRRSAVLKTLAHFEKGHA